MPISKYFGGHGSEVLSNMEHEYGAKKGKSVFYATANKRGEKPGKDDHEGEGFEHEDHRPRKPKPYEDSVKPFALDSSVRWVDQYPRCYCEVDGVRMGQVVNERPGLVRGYRPSGTKTFADESAAKQWVEEGCSVTRARDAIIPIPVEPIVDGACKECGKAMDAGGAYGMCAGCAKDSKRGRLHAALDRRMAADVETQRIEAKRPAPAKVTQPFHMSNKEIEAAYKPKGEVRVRDSDTEAEARLNCSRAERAIRRGVMSEGVTYAKRALQQAEKLGHTAIAYRAKELLQRAESELGLYDPNQELIARKRATDRLPTPIPINKGVTPFRL